MADYAIGDVQGCFDALMALLEHIAFDPAQDHLYFCGDLVNRGGKSLEVLRWVYAHQYCCDVVLGNHDLSLLARYHLPGKATCNSEQLKVFEATDASLLMDWLIQQPLIIELDRFVIVHAGIYPLWSLQQAHAHAHKASAKIRKNPKKFLKLMFGSKPTQWRDDLDKVDHMRFTINAFTRMRFVTLKGRLNFRSNGHPDKVKRLQPWFGFTHRVSISKHILFGHWSALGYFSNADCTCLDTGKVWGRELTAMRLQDGHIFQI